MTWNKKNDQYALSCGLRQSSERLQRWLLRRAKPNEVCEIEIDLREFNQFIARDRDRGGYDRKTLKEALAQLDEKTQGWIMVSKSYTWAIHKLRVRPLFMVLQQNSQTGDNAPKLKTGDPMFDGKHKKRVNEQQQQDISKLKTLFSKLGMSYTEDALTRLWRYADKKVSQVQDAVEYMLYCHSEKLNQSEHELGAKGISKPHGWLNECLKYGWHINAGFYSEMELPYLDNLEEIKGFVGGILGLLPYDTQQKLKQEMTIPI